MPTDGYARRRSLGLPLHFCLPFDLPDASSSCNKQITHPPPTSSTVPLDMETLSL
jgi:hypothetical protein